MAKLLIGAKALVTGAGRGIGVEIAKLFATEGAKVAVHYRGSRDGAEETARVIQNAGGTATVLQADLTNETDAARLVAQTLDALGGLDILVNNAAGFGEGKTIADHTWDEINDEWLAVTKPVVVLTQAALPHLIAQKHGRIVSLSATLLQRPAERYGAHAMAKAAVLAFTRTLAREVGEHGITVNAVSPGVALTEFSLNQSDAFKTAVASRTPLRRIATPEDVAKAVLFFASPLADFITGANLAPDGGLAVL